MKKSIGHHKVKLLIVAFALIASSAYFAYGEDVEQEKTSQESEDWVVAKKKEEVGYEFEGYIQDQEIEFVFEDKEFRLEKAAFRKDDEIWVPLDETFSKLGFMLLKIDEDSFCAIRDDGMPLEADVGDTVVKMNKSPFLTLPQAPRVHLGTFYATLDSLAMILDISYTYDSPTNTVNLSKAEAEEFSTFTVERPPAPVEEKPKPVEIKPLPPPDIREELLPPEYKRDVDMKVDTTFSYLQDKFAHDRTRQADWYISGYAFDWTVDGRFRMRDYRGLQKQRFKEDGEFLGLYQENIWFKFLDNYLTIPKLRSQSQSYFGMEVTDFYEPFKSTIIVGETQNTVAGPTDVGSVRYDGDLYALKQDYTDVNNLFDVSAIVLWHQTEAESQAKSSTTNYPRRNLFYMIDTTTHLYPNLNLYYTHALSDYTPDNKVNKHLKDDNWRVGVALDEKLYSLKTNYEHVGQQYVSIGIPSTYQDYEGLDFSTNFKFTPTWSTTLGGRMSKNNVERNPRRQTNFDKSLSAGTGFMLPWQQSLNLSHSVTETTTKGGDVDLSGTRYKDYRIDYVKGWTNLTVQLSYNHYLLEPFGTSTGGSFTDSYSLTFMQFYPELNNSYLRFYQDMRKTKTISDASYTTTNWNSDVGARWNLTNYLSASGDLRVATTQKEAFKDTALVTLILGGEFKSSPVTTWNLDYNLSNYDLYDPENQTTKHYTVLFKVRHIFDVETPEKWGKVKTFVYRDLNSNGRHDEGELGMPNIRVNIVNGRAATTDSKGLAAIKKVVPGKRKVKIDLSTLPLEMAVRGAPPVQAIIVEPLKASMAEFPIVRTGKIKGRVYVDVDKDGRYEKLVDEVIPNARVYSIPSSKDTLTFSDGSYYLEYVYPGEHDVAIDLETISPDYKLSSPQKIKVSLKEGEVLTDLDFIFSPKPIIIERFDKE